MTSVVVYDACVLYSAPLRDLLIRIARAGLVRARWTDRILDECFRAILRQRPELEAPLRRTRELMITAIPDGIVGDHEGLIEGLELPDPDDRHVLAAAIRSGAQAIVTFNLSDFPTDVVSAFHVVAMHPDTFIVELIDAEPDAVAAVVARQACDLRSPPCSIEELLDTLRRAGLPATALRLSTQFAV